jgi:glucose/arabinose dehydrogenase
VRVGSGLTNRLRVLTGAALVVTVLATAGASAGAENSVPAPITDRGVVVELAPYVQIPNTSLGRPRLNSFATTGDRLFVVEDYDGKIYEIKGAGQSGIASLFFDVKASVLAATGRRLDNTSIFHGGLRAVAFHPNFAINGLFYTSIMEQRPANPNPADYLSDVPTPIVADSVLVEWTFDHDAGSVDASSYRQVFRVGMPVYDHPIKQIAFNPFAEPGGSDFGKIYIAHGDGSVQSATAGGGMRNDARGKILRINPRQATNGDPYRIPPENPFVGTLAMPDEVWSLGHRNPHHLAFAQDAAGNSRLLVAEAGRDNVEEVNVIVRGANYGWAEREGTFVHLPSGDLLDGIAPLPSDEAEFGYTYPAAQVGHDGARGQGFSGQSIAGGYVIDNGSALSGQYFYSDFPKSGRLFHSTLDDLLTAVTQLDPDVANRDAPTDLTQAPTGEATIMFDHDANPSTPSLLRSNLLDVFNDAASYDRSGRADVRFGQGVDGELYISSKKNGWVYLVTNSLPPTESCNGFVATTTGLVGTSGDDVIVGTGGPDVINGLGGNDVICGRGGADKITGGAGADLINAGWGSDVVRAGDGDDTVFAGPGLDDVEGGSGNDILRGGRGGDRIVGNSGNDELYGGDRKDRIFGYSGNDQLFGGAGDDNLRGGAGTDSAVGGLGDDRCADVRTRVSCEQG